MRDIGALSSNGDVFIKALPSELPSELRGPWERGGRKNVRTRGDWMTPYTTGLMSI